MNAATERLNPKQEAFAVHLAMGANLVEAYRNAGFAANGNAANVNATKLAKLAKVRLRVGSLQAKMDEARMRAQAATIIVTAQSVSAMLADAFEQAKQHRQIGAQVAAAMGLAKLHGLLVDKTEDVTRRATRDPAAPVEIDVEHWVTEQSALLLGQSPADPPASDRAPPEMDTVSQRSPEDEGSDLGLGAPEPRSPETQVSE